MCKQYILNNLQMRMNKTNVKVCLWNVLPCDCAGQGAGSQAVICVQRPWWKLCTCNKLSASDHVNMTARDWIVIYGAAAINFIPISWPEFHLAGNTWLINKEFFNNLVDHNCFTIPAKEVKKKLI